MDLLQKKKDEKKMKITGNSIEEKNEKGSRAEKIKRNSCKSETE